MKLETRHLIAVLALAGLLSGCAANAPTQLVEARNAYATSSKGIAAQLAPSDLYEAKKALDAANQEFVSNGDTAKVHDYAYIAKRKTQLADVNARTEADRRSIAAAVKKGVAVRDEQVKRAQTALAGSRETLRDERYANAAETTALEAANAAQGKNLERTAAQLEAERQARMTAEARLAGAMKDLATIAAVREDARGVVITLSGSVLFASGKYELLETAKIKLDQVAEALKARSDDRKIVVEGHTDSRGSDALNDPLSLNRAKAVRNYLISRGVEADKISAVGLGSKRPLFDNRSAENRANNRRVEIVIQSRREEQLSTR